MEASQKHQWARWEIFILWLFLNVMFSILGTVIALGYYEVIDAEQPRFTWDNDLIFSPRNIFVLFPFAWGLSFLFPLGWVNACGLVISCWLKKVKFLAFSAIGSFVLGLIWLGLLWTASSSV